MHSICERVLYISLLAANDFHFRLLFSLINDLPEVPGGRAPKLIKGVTTLLTLSDTFPALWRPSSIKVSRLSQVYNNKAKPKKKIS